MIPVATPLGSSTSDPLGRRRPAAAAAPAARRSGRHARVPAADGAGLVDAGAEADFYDRLARTSATSPTNRPVGARPGRRRGGLRVRGRRSSARPSDGLSASSAPRAIRHRRPGRLRHDGRVRPAATAPSCLRRRTRPRWPRSAAGGRRRDRRSVVRARWQHGDRRPPTGCPAADRVAVADHGLAPVSRQRTTLGRARSAKMAKENAE